MYERSFAAVTDGGFHRVGLRMWLDKACLCELNVHLWSIGVFLWTFLRSNQAKALSTLPNCFGIRDEMVPHDPLDVVHSFCNRK